MAVINRIDEQAAARIRELMQGNSTPPKRKSSGVRKPHTPKLVLSDSTSVHRDGRLLVFQRGIIFDERVWHHKRLPKWALTDIKARERDGQIAFMLDRMPLWARDEAQRARVRHIDFIRLARKSSGKGIADDNLRPAWKYVRDATCGVVLWGFDVLKHQRTKIGYADDELERRGVTWTYIQTQSEAQPLGYGIQVRLHLSPE